MFRYVEDDLKAYYLVNYHYVNQEFQNNITFLILTIWNEICVFLWFVSDGTQYGSLNQMQMA